MKVACQPAFGIWTMVCVLQASPSWRVLEQPLPLTPRRVLEEVVAKAAEEARRVVQVATEMAVTTR